MLRREVCFYFRHHRLSAWIVLSVHEITPHGPGIFQIDIDGVVRRSLKDHFRTETKTLLSGETGLLKDLFNGTGDYVLLGKALTTNDKIHFSVRQQIVSRHDEHRSESDHYQNFYCPVPRRLSACVAIGRKPLNASDETVENDRHTGRRQTADGDGKQIPRL